MADSGGLIDRLESIISRDPNNTSDQVIPLHKLISNGNHTTEKSINTSETITKSPLEIGIIFVAYSIVFLISLLVNLLVLYITCRNRRLRTVTNSFITNLSVSDIFITLFNIPFNIIRIITNEWILGEYVCQCASFILMVSVYVSTFTMTAIAIDRYRVILNPLRPRVSFGMGLVIVIGTWILGTLMSLPFAIFAKVTKVEMILHTARRCVLHYPEPSHEYERYITLTTFLCQYVLPLLVTLVTYTHIAYKLWSRHLVGQSIENQRVSHLKSRKRSIKMLIVVVVMFSICWLPLNLYHLLTDFHPNTEMFPYNSTVYLSFHWLAVSSVCYNPLIYCWSKETFRAELRKCIMWIIQSWPRCCAAKKDSQSTSHQHRRENCHSMSPKLEYRAVAVKGDKGQKAVVVTTSNNTPSLRSSERMEMEVCPITMSRRTMDAYYPMSVCQPSSDGEHSKSSKRDKRGSNSV